MVLCAPKFTDQNHDIPITAIKLMQLTVSLISRFNEADTASLSMSKPMLVIYHAYIYMGYISYTQT